MDAYETRADRAWKLQAFNLHLTIDHLEAIANQHTFESFCESATVASLVRTALSEISDMVRRIPIHIRVAHPDVPWPFLRSLDALLEARLFSENPAAAWQILNGRILPGAAQLAPLVSRLDLTA